MNSSILKKTIIKAIGVSVVATLSSALYAASFDCANVAAPIEKLVCSDETVSNLDADLARVYKVALEKAENKDALKQQQRAWLKEKRNACKEASCLTQIYQARIAELIPNDRSLVPIVEKSTTEIEGAVNKSGIKNLYLLNSCMAIHTPCVSRILIC